MLPAHKQNVRQHVVPQVYLKRFADAGHSLKVQDVGSGKVYPGNPPQLCVENDVYTLLRERTRDDSFDRINNRVEESIGSLYRRLAAGVDVDDDETKREVFTILAVFTANLIARSRVLRDYFNHSLDNITAFLNAHPDFFDNYP